MVETKGCFDSSNASSSNVEARTAKKEVAKSTATSMITLPLTVRPASVTKYCAGVMSGVKSTMRSVLGPVGSAVALLVVDDVVGVAMVTVAVPLADMVVLPLLPPPPLLWCEKRWNKPSTARAWVSTTVSNGTGHRWKWFLLLLLLLHHQASGRELGFRSPRTDADSRDSDDRADDDFGCADGDHLVSHCHARWPRVSRGRTRRRRNQVDTKQKRGAGCFGEGRRLPTYRFRGGVFYGRDGRGIGNARF
ncbi:hypothetical protein VTK73DRAFT_6246 [Phialemonium thermophilum]|uniref:Uncharacterized protein n=1 Tax=Phialemonium thermophilum TaxID=223376 RepID=A0ABR3UZT5_9PEZI